MANAATPTQINVAAAGVREDRLALWRERHTRMLRMVVGSYAVDTLLLLAFWLTGAVPLASALLYGVTAAASSLGFYAVIQWAPAPWFKRHVIVLLQMVVAVLHNLAFVVWAPQVGALMLPVLFIVYAFGTLSMRRGLLVTTCLGLTVLVGMALAESEPLAFPMATLAQRLMCGLWVSSILARCVFIGRFGARIRESLNRRNVELEVTHGQLEALALRDELTGALNRRSIMQVLAGEASKFEQGGPPFGAALFDLDHFKQINDIHGHVVGDHVLRRFTTVVASELRSGDRLGRYGGEEFLVVVGAGTSLSALLRVGERARHRLAEVDWADLSQGLSVTVSVGVALARNGESTEALIERADGALYRAKREGRNRVCLDGAADQASSGIPLSA